MRRWNRWATSDDGSAALEFILAGVVMLVPLVYLILTLGLVQEQTLGAEAAARHTARVIGQSPDAETALQRSQLVLDGVVDEYGMDADSLEFSLSCTPSGRICPSAGSTVLVTVRTQAALPLVPPILGLDSAAVIPIEAHAAQKVSRLWGER